MILGPGTRLGVYEVTAPLGEGGMGQVYRATDTTLGRQVAIKILPEAFAADLERLARFEREARTLASLNHPHIAAIYGFEQSTPSTGSGQAVKAIVMELVEGEDLSQRLARGPIPVDEALPIARQIAEALEAAHEQGIIHRDLKPANIKLRPDGTVKVLDFGLAKPMLEGSGLQSAGSGNAGLSLSPTLTSPAMMTGVGTVLGTAAYMAPEQAKGRTIDRRADVWAFGAVLYEMLTATRAFAGSDVSEVLASVLAREPDWTRLPRGVSPALATCIRRCLHRDPKQRIGDMQSVRLALEGAFETAALVPARHGRSRSWLVWGSAVIAVMSLVVAGVAISNRPSAVRPTAVRLTIPLPAGQELTSYPAITPDGQTVAYVTRQGTEDPQLYLRDLGSFEPRLVAGSSGALQPFFSPDGKWVAFFAQGQLQKAEVRGGAPVRLAAALNPFGGTWNDDNTIIYAGSLNSGLLRIPAGGGTPESLTRPDGGTQGYAHAFPQALPGGRRVLFSAWGPTGGTAVLSLDSGKWDVVLPTNSFASGMFEATSGSTGRILLVDQTAGIRAAPFDAARPAPTSIDTSVLTDVYYDVENESRGWLAISTTGTAVYASGNPARTSLVWVDRGGNIEPLVKEQDLYRDVSLSPDGLKAVVRHELDLWIHDLQRGSRIRFTSNTGANILPLWSPDSARILFASNRGGDWDIYSQAVDGSGPAQILLKRPYDQFPYSMLADGTLLYLELNPTTARDLWTLSPDGKTTLLRGTPYNELSAQFSPGAAGGPRWVAYTSDESGRNEIFVQSYPSGANRVPVSTGGGVMPRWSHDGKELFYMAGDALMAVPMRPDGSFDAARRLFDRANFLVNPRFHSYAVSPDGKRFLMIQRDPGSVPRQLNVILNWSDGR